nr:translocation/assembly module TamB domain-containing protein [Luteimonas galliterrae]
MPASVPRKRFYRRKKFWAWSGGSVALLAIGAVLLLYWLLQTVAGRDVLLAQIIARLPPGASLKWEKVEGPLAGPLILHGLDLRWDKIHFTAERAYLDPDIRPLLGRRLRLDAMQLTNATLDVPKSDEPFKLPSWPESLPNIEMPLAIQADALAIDGFDISQSGEHVIDIRKLRGGVDVATGLVHVEKLAIDSDRGDFSLSGDYMPQRDYRTNMIGTATFPAPRGRTPAKLSLNAQGDLSKMDVLVSGNAPAPLRAMLTFTGKEDPVWHFSAKTEALDLALLLPPEEGAAAAEPQPLSFDLTADGKGGSAQLRGTVAQGDMAVTLQPSKVKLDDQVLTVAPLVVDAYDGRATLHGRADFTVPEEGKFRFAVNARGFKFGAAPDPAQPKGAAAPVPIGVDADLGIAGRIKDWAAVGNARIARGEQKATVDLDVRGDTERATIKTLRAKMPTGTLDATGKVGWTPVLDWDLRAKLAGFDPGYFAPGWDGNVSGQLASKGKQRPTTADGQPGGFDATLDVPALSGKLRGRPLQGRGKFALRGEQGEGDLALKLGNSRIDAKGKVGDKIDIAANLQPLQLDDLLPDAAGTLRGKVLLKGNRDTPDITADLVGSGVKWSGYAAESLSIKGRLLWRGSGGELAVRGTNVAAGMVLESLRVDARGAIENLQVDGDARNAMGAVALSGNARKTGARWQGTLATLQLTPSKGAAWRLRQPAPFIVNPPSFSLADACLGAEGGGELCANAVWPQQGVTVKAAALPLTLLQPWLPPNEGRPLLLRGEVSLDGHIKPRGNAWEGKIHVASLEGGLRIGDKTRREIVRYDNFTFDADFDPLRIQARLGTGFRGDGFIDARVATGWDDYAPLTGDIYLNMSRLFWLELFSPDLVRPEGLIEGHVSLSGTRAKPALGGEADLTNFKGELPALGLNLSEGRMRLDALPDGSARISGSVKTGEGALTVEGGLSWYGQATPLQLNIRGENVLVADTSQLRAVANPNLQFGIVDKTMQLRGEVTVPSADIDLERLEMGVSASADVVVLDPEDPEEAPSSPLDMDLAVVLGDDVNMKGFGLTGKIGGRMQVRARPGREMVANGRLDVDGKYKAYGQQLDITRGELSWSNSIVSDPIINIRAERHVGDVTAGIDVTGRAQAPRAQVWSDPAMQRSEAMAYLVLGRSLEGATGGEAQQVDAASAALAAGSGVLASQLGAKLGFDDAGVSQSRALGGSVVGVGKYLSPRLYVGYGVSLVGSGQVLTLKYLLRKGFDVQVESSTVENRASINWRKEK